MNELATNAQDLQSRVLAQRKPPTPPAAQAPAAPSTPKLTALQHAIMDEVEQQADVIKDAAFAATMAALVPIGKGVGASGFKIYLDKLVKESGSPSDPIERMMIEQIALAHHRIAGLHLQAEQAKSPEAAKIYLTAAIRLTGELRRLALGLRQYRQPMTKRMVQFVKQQNLASGNQQVAYLDQPDSQDQIPFCSNETQEGNNKRLSHAPQTTFVPEPQAAGSRSAEPAPARPADARRARTIATGRPQDQTVVTGNGADDARG